MNLTLIDWSIFSSALIALAMITLWVRKYTHSVSDFLAANRSAGRYLLTLAEGMASFGVASLVANFEKFYQAGFAAFWWGKMLAPFAMIIAMSGWVAYRYRETRVMTMAQFFEVRYSKNFRIFSGILGWISGILNYGVFPGIVANFFIYFCGLPETVIIGGFEIRTLMLIMAVFLSIALALVFFGGMIAVMVTDFFQAQFLNIVFLILLIAIAIRVGWGDTVEALSSTAPGQSLLDPFDQQKISDFNFWFFAIFVFKAFYNCLGWQAAQGYNAAARTPHEAKMARVLAEWRNGVTYLMLMILPIGAYVVMHHAGYMDIKTTVDSALTGISDPQLAKQMTVPITLVSMLPVGVIGLLAAAMAMASISTDDSCLHSWGSILIQDIILPFRRNKPPLSPKAHIRLLRCSMIFVAVFVFLWSSYFPIRDYLFMYFFLTGTIYLGGSGAVIVGGLYWRRGTTQGAWAAMITGCTIAVLGLAIQVIWPYIPALLEIGPKFPINGAWLAMIAYVCSIIAYIGVSLFTCKEPANLERILHRGKYAIESDTPKSHKAHASIPVWKRALGFTEDFTKGDRFIYYIKLAWTAFWTIIFVVGTAVGLTVGISKEAWASYWYFVVIISAIVGSATIVWFLWGGFKDLKDLLRRLKQEKVDVQDDGQIHDTPSLATSAVPAETSATTPKAFEKHPDKPH